MRKVKGYKWSLWKHLNVKYNKCTYPFARNISRDRFGFKMTNQYRDSYHELWSPYLINGKLYTLLVLALILLIQSLYWNGALVSGVSYVKGYIYDIVLVWNCKKHLPAFQNKYRSASEVNYTFTNNLRPWLPHDNTNVTWYTEWIIR